MTKTSRQPRITVLYQYFHPDDVVSAVHFSDLCEELAKRGWLVTAHPCNRSARNAARKFRGQETWRGVRVRRVWRPNLPQHSAVGRVVSAAWMLSQWLLAVLRDKPDCVIVGTDPVLSVTVARLWRWLRPATVIAHWCFDLYPEAAIADGLLREPSRLTRLLRRAVAAGYRSCDLVVDIGSCMQSLLQSRYPVPHNKTLTPWALAEPPMPLNVDQAEREAVFGTTKLALLYSGSYGKAHSSDLILELAQRLKSADAEFRFSVRGNCVDQLTAASLALPNVGLVSFAAQDQLETRLSSADIHIVSLREQWTGTVVPSKFFGAIAAGRPVLFCGSFDSAVAKWIREYELGWVLNRSTIDSVTETLLEFVQDPKRLHSYFVRCHSVYRRHFSKAAMVREWDRSLKHLLPGSGDPPQESTAQVEAPVAVAPRNGLP